MDGECSYCTGEYCAVHHDRPCDCDTAERHGDEESVFLDLERWTLAEPTDDPALVSVDAEPSRPGH